MNDIAALMFGEEKYFYKAAASGYPLQKRRKWRGLDISVENRRGSYRTDKHHKPPQWKTKMLCDYGYIKATEGVDGDHLDVFMGNYPAAKYVYVVNQVIPKTGKFDEQKFMLDFKDMKSAKRMYLKHYDTPKFFGSIKKMPVEEFIAKAKSSLHGSKLIKSLIFDEVMPRRMSVFAKAARKTEQPRGSDGRFIVAGTSRFGKGFTANSMTPADQEHAQQQGEIALAKVLLRHEDVNAAMSRPDVGEIDFVWGDAGGGPPKNKRAHGIAGIIAKHGTKSLHAMPEVIAKGDLGPLDRSKTRRKIRWKKHTAVISLNDKGTKRTWLLNGFGPIEDDPPEQQERLRKRDFAKGYGGHRGNS